MNASGLENILNYDFIHEHLSTSGQPTTEQLLQIKENGFSTVINIAADEKPDFEEDKYCLELGLDYIYIPISLECPSPVMSLLLLDMVSYLVQEQKVWLHCTHNQHVSSLMYLYRQYYMNMDMPTASAYLERIWQPNATWTGLMHAVQIQLQARQATYEISQMA